MPSKPDIRANMSANGSYVSIAGSLQGADEGIKHVLKMAYTTRIGDIADPIQLETMFVTDHVLIDFKSLTPSALRVDRIIADCDHVKQIAEKHPRQLKQLLDAYTSSPTGFEKANAIAQEIGLTEEGAIDAGGGCVWLVLLVAVAVMAKACTDAQNGNPQGKPKPLT